MELPIPNKVMKLWDAWHIRGCIIMSLFLQAFLALLAPCRRRTKSTLMLFPIWSAYLLADWVAAIAIGAIIKTQSDTCDPPKGDDDLFAFWASFLLLHLGGPDSITSFALEDNELWLRHLLGLVLQGVAAAYSLLLTLPNNKLWLPSMFVFVVGIIKYGERTYALYLASLKRIEISASNTDLPDPNGAAGPQTQDAGDHEIEETKASTERKAGTSHDHKIDEEAEASAGRKEISNSPSSSRDYETEETKASTERKASTSHDHEIDEDAEAAIERKETSNSPSSSHHHDIEETEVSRERKASTSHDHEIEEAENTRDRKEIISNSSSTYHDHGIEEADTSTERRETPNSSSNSSSNSDELGTSLLTTNDPMILLELAHQLFQIFKGLIVDVPLRNSFRALISRAFRQNCHTSSALRVIEYELSMFYEVLHTKALATRRKVGYVLRFISFSFIVAASALFFSIEKQKDHGVLHNFDIRLTYALLIGAVVLDATSFTHLIFSDWMLGAFEGKRWKRYVPFVVIKKRRWSESVFQYNLISYCLDKHPKWVYNLDRFLGKRILDKLKLSLFSSSEIVTEDLKRFVFAQLKERSHSVEDGADGVNECFSKGERTLDSFDKGKLKWSVSEFQYTETFLLWHLATELVNYCHDEEEQSSNTSSSNPNKRTCKLLSDYMFYLIVMQPSMLSPVLGPWDVVFQDTCAEAKRFFHKHKLLRDCDHLKACKKIISVETKSDKLAASVKGCFESKSLLFDACKLAKELRELEDPWKVIARMWVELLSCAASHCEAIVHAQQLGKGGELLTFTWLLMYHLGMGLQLSSK